MGLILDASVLVAAERQGQNARQMLSTISARTSETEIGTSVVTLIELAHGAARADSRIRLGKRGGQMVFGVMERHMVRHALAVNIVPNE
jgi:predicted nucleic acid-binding protein